MATMIEPEDIVIWVSITPPPHESLSLDWGVNPIQSIDDREASTRARRISFAFEQIVASQQVLSSFRNALRNVRSMGDVEVTASLGVYFDTDMASQNFALGAALMKELASLADDIEISVYSTA